LTSLEIGSELKERFPGLRVLVSQVGSVRVGKRSEELEEFKSQLLEQVRGDRELEELKDDPIFRVYRDFFWRVGIDPTKNRPAGEALVRRVLRGKPIPTINTLVDAYNLASIKTGIALAAFDLDRLAGDLEMRLALEGEEFLGIGMDKPMALEGNEVVISDAEKLMAIYPYRDADSTKVTGATENVLLLVCGVPGIDEDALRGAEKTAVEYITRFCGGER
jgi:DNA/RNA-binding domain of Phe-tRNA-synthetase-like protein